MSAQAGSVREPAPSLRSRWPSPGSVTLAAVLLTAGVALAVVVQRGPAPARTMQERVRAVAEGLRCPVCQDLSVADSPSSVAQQMRQAIATDLRAGRAPAQIRAQFVSAYGAWILMTPPRSGIGLVVWVAPGLLLLAGVVIALTAIRRWTLGVSPTLGGPGSDQPVPQANGLSPDDRRLLERALSSVEEQPE